VKKPISFYSDEVSREWIADKIAPRPILFVAIDNDRLVELYTRAGEPEKLVFIERLRAVRGLLGAGVQRGSGYHRVAPAVPAGEMSPGAGQSPAP
jgi:hypothetical protein